MAGSGSGENLFSDHRTIHLMILMTILSSAIKWQYTLVARLDSELSASASQVIGGHPGAI